VVEDYPRNLTELEANFGTEEACRAYLAGCDGRTVFAVHVAVVIGHGLCEEYFWSALAVAAKLQ
jgi:hypothetical protein